MDVGRISKEFVRALKQDVARSPRVTLAPEDAGGDELAKGLCGDAVGFRSSPLLIVRKELLGVPECKRGYTDLRSPLLLKDSRAVG
jgi:hypothetical protein